MTDTEVLTTSREMAMAVLELTNTPLINKTSMHAAEHFGAWLSSVESHWSSLSSGEKTLVAVAWDLWNGHRLPEAHLYNIMCLERALRFKLFHILLRCAL